jgi:hypothetical protein
MQTRPVVLGTLGLLLAVSLLLNVVAFTRMNGARSERSSASPTASPAAPAPARPAAPASADARLDQVLLELAQLRREVARLSGGASPAPVTAAAPGSGAPADAPTLTFDDPQVARVIQEQSEWRSFWRQLDRVFDARSQLDETVYQKSVFDATTDFLGLQEPARAQFVQSAKLAAVDLARVRREYDEARNALPSRTADPQGYETQRRQLDLRYRDQLKAVVDRVRVYLDPAQTRHSEFSDQAYDWLRKLGPRS